MRRKGISLSFCGSLTITEHLVEIKPLTGQEVNTGTLWDEMTKDNVPFSLPQKKKKNNNQPINQQTSQLLFNKLKYCHYQKSMTNDTVEDLLDKWTLCPGMSCWTVSGKYKN